MECCDPSTTDNEHHENASRFEWLRHGLYDGFLLGNFSEKRPSQQVSNVQNPEMTFH